jgi:hypothetical protein
MLTIDGVKYNLWTPKDEENEFHPLVRKNYKQIFGEGSLYFDLKQRLSSKSGLIGIPDAYVITLTKPYSWYIVENELSTHDVYEHIVGQVSKFMSLIDEPGVQNELARAICREIDQDEELHAYIKKRVGAEIFRFLSDLFLTQPKIALVIDSITPKLDKALNTLNKLANTEVVEFKTYVREGAENVRAHVFEPLSGENTGPGGLDSGAAKEKGGEEQPLRHRKRLAFWSSLLERSKNKTKLFSNRKPSKECWINMGAGKTGFAYGYIILMKAAWVELYIDTGDQNRNKQIFDKLHSQKTQIEQNFGDQLDWQRLNGKRACRIAKKTSKDKGLLNEEEWPSIQDAMIDAIIRLENALREPISQLK